jgi:hypothetical protein
MLTKASLFLNDLKIKVLHLNNCENTSKQAKENIKMSYLTHNEISVNRNGTSLKGYIECDYYLLVTLFGQPFNGDTTKSDAEWLVKFDDGVIASIYNYKDGYNYCGHAGTPTEKIKTWHVGGFNDTAVYHVQHAIDEYVLDCLESTYNSNHSMFEEA